MADVACLSRSAFAERCHKVIDMSPKHMIDVLRMQHARHMLIHTSATIDQIAEATGYQSATAFIRFFKQRESCSPGEFRQHHT